MFSLLTRAAPLIILAPGSAALALALNVGQCSAQHRLKLAELASYPLPFQFFVSGVVAENDHQILLWSEVDDYLLVLKNGSIERVGGGHLTAAVGAGFGDAGSVEAVQGEPGMILTFRGGEVHRAPIGLSPVRAVRLESGWVFATVNHSESGEHLVLFHSPNPGHEIRWLADLPARIGESHPAHLSATTGGVLVTEAVAPFQVTRVWLSGEVAKLENPTRELPFPVSASAPAFAVGPGVMQNLSDTRSEQKAVKLFGSDGFVQRVTPYNLPVVLLAASNDGEVVVGIRSLKGRELVVYSWDGEF